MMKRLTIAVLILGPLTATAEDWSKHSVAQLVDSYLVAKASPSYLLDPKDLKERVYTIQVASHINEKDAIQHVELLKLQENEVFYYPNFVKSQVFFKVCVGRFHTQEEAEKYRKDFMRRMDEPFAVTIAMTDKPGVDPVATKAQTASASKKMNRQVASVHSDEAIDLKKESQKSTSQPDVKLMPKTATPTANPVAAAIQPGMSKMYALQVAAYPTEELAKAEVEKYKVPGQEVFYRAADVNGKTWYRVFVGKFNKFSEAQAFQDVYREQRPGQTIIRKFVN